MPYQPPNARSQDSFQVMMKASSGSFYLHDNSSNSMDSLQAFPQNRLAPSRMPSVNSLPTLATANFPLLKSVTESPQSYSYTMMSTNSLALRLRGLKRSLEILLERPDLIHSSLGSADKKNSTSTLQSLLTVSHKCNDKANALSPMLEDLHAFVDMLEKGDDLNFNYDQEQAIIDFHNLSLSNVKESKPLKSKDDLKRQLLLALSTPFVENNSNSNKSVLGFSMVSTPSSLGLSTLNNLPDDDFDDHLTSSSNKRQIHSSATGKTKSPKAIFTISANSPWNLLNVNDIGLLMFGMSKSSLNKRKLMDLIAPRSRDLVYKRLQRDSNLVFSGEIIAVKRDNKDISWTSLWAKKINDRIFMIFEQITCETIDVVIENNKEINDYFVQQVLKQSSCLYLENLQNEKLKSFLPSIFHTLKTVTTIGSEKSTKDSKIINKVRYFTLLTEKGNFVPCAVTTEPLIDADDQIQNSKVTSLFRLNLHSIPYIAGTFVINARNRTIASFNEAVAKNLFGTSDLKGSFIDKILPGFTNLLTQAEAENSNMIDQNGLVLPEHYFRRLLAWTQGVSIANREQLFLTSKGIIGMHNDGNEIMVDVQLRVAESGFYVLWITFCRNILQLNTNINSQLPLLWENDSQNNINTGLDDLSRSSSVKTLKGNDNEDYFTSPSTPLVPRKTPVTPPSNSSTNSPLLKFTDKSFSGSAQSLSPTDSKSSNSLNEIQFASPLYNKLLKEETKRLETMKKRCPHFPIEIGSQRRTKSKDDFINLKDLGSGAYGEVWFARLKKDKYYEVCIKSIVKERILVDSWVRDRKLGTVPSEIQILNKIQLNPHPNILHMIDYFEDAEYYHIETLPHCDINSSTIDLYDLIELKKDLEESECAYIFSQVVSALCYLHNNGIIHRDIKDENLVIDASLHVRLIDFGSAAFVKDGPFRVFLGTLEYAAPEVLDGEWYNGKEQDVWALGVLLYTLVYKENPFIEVSEILDGHVSYEKGGSDEVKELIDGMLKTKISERWTIDEIKNHRWLKKADVVMNKFI